MAEIENTEEQPQAAPETTISWTASEFIAHHKTSGWYVRLAGVAILIAAILYLLTRDEITSGFVLFGALLLGIYAAREPRQLPYIISEHGINIGEKYYAFEQFRSFAVVPEGAFSSIVFTPLKRFGQLVTIYFAPEDEDRIIDVLEQRLPFDDTHNDPIDNLMRRIRF